MNSLKLVDNKIKPLNLTSDNILTIFHELRKKEEATGAEVTMIFDKVKQFQDHELLLSNNNYKLQLLMNNHRESNEALIAAIVDKVEAIDRIDKRIEKCKKKHEMESKSDWEAVQNGIAFYGRAMVDAQDEYRSINLRNEIDYYEKRAAGVVEDNGQLESIIQHIQEQTNSHPCAAQLVDVQQVIEMLNGEEDTLLREIREQENIHLEVSREIKQLKMEIAELQKP